MVKFRNEPECELLMAFALESNRKLFEQEFLLVKGQLQASL